MFNPKIFLAVVAIAGLAGCMNPIADIVGAVNMATMAPDVGTFNQIDCSRDGKLSLAEVSSRVSIRPSGAGSAHAVTAAEFNAADRDRSGGLDMSELSVLLTGGVAWSVTPVPCSGSVPALGP